MSLPYSAALLRRCQNKRRITVTAVAATAVFGLPTVASFAFASLHVGQYQHLPNLIPRVSSPMSSTAIGCNDRPASLSSALAPPPLPSPLFFGPYEITPDQVFFQSHHSMAIVNLKPLVPCHVLILPYRVVERFSDLRPEEVSDLYRAVHEIGPVLQTYQKKQGLTISMQDGKAAGQTVPHVHVHVLPRLEGDFTPNDKVYEELEAVHLKKHFDLDVERRPRTQAEMAAEALELRKLFPHRQGRAEGKEGV